MRTSFIDYSRLYHERIARSPLPSLRRGKFVQIWHGDEEEYIVAAPKGLATLHAHIVERFLNEQGVVGEYTAKRDVYLLRTSAWVVLGGGHFELDEQVPLLRLDGFSYGYGPFERHGLDERLAACPELEGYRIIVE